MSGACKPRAKRRHTGRVTRYTPDLAEQICARIEAGEGLNGICRDPALPCRETILNWRTTVPGFRARYELARALQARARVARGLSPLLGGGPSRYSETLARTICDRLAAGASLLTICADPTMPCYRSVLNWLRQVPDFRAAYDVARADQAHALADEVLHTVRRDDLPPADKQARIKGLAWYASKVAPRKYGEEAEVPESGDGALFQVVIVKNGGMEGTG